MSFNNYQFLDKKKKKNHIILNFPVTPTSYKECLKH